MCFSKEVSLTAGTLMVSCIAYTWWAYIRNKPKDPSLPVYRNILIGYFGVALHQFGDFLSILTESEIIYKLGLIASISCMFFYMRALEQLSHLSFGSRIFALLIVLCSIQILFSNFAFKNMGFWVRGDEGGTYLLWTSMCVALFIYWNICLLYFRNLNSSINNRRLLILYGLYTINTSYILYILYAYLSLIIKSIALKEHMNVADVFTSFNLVKDSPSIWCAFSVVQIFLIPRLFNKMNSDYEWHSPVSITQINWATRFKLLGLSLIAWLIILIGFPLFFGAALKMVA